MASRTGYRDQLKGQILGLEDGGYGDFEYSDDELDVFVDISVIKMFPAIYKKVKLSEQSVTAYGTGAFGEVILPASVSEARVFMVEDSVERDPLIAWQTRPGSLVNLAPVEHPLVNIYYTDAFVLPVDDDEDSNIPVIYTPLIVLGALIEACQARQDTGVRGEPAPTGVFHETQLLDRLLPRYERLLDSLAMSLPGMVT